MTTACPVYTNTYLFFDKKKNSELANIWRSLHFYCKIILVKKKCLCIGMAWLPFQKYLLMEWIMINIFGYVNYGFSVEVESNSENSRAAIYVSSNIDYIRRGDLEGTDSNLIIIDLKGSMNLRIINIYRSHSPQQWCESEGQV